MNRPVSAGPTPARRDADGGFEQPVNSPAVTHFYHNPKGQIDALHGLRFLAAFSILVLHATDWVPHPDSFPWFAHVGNLFGIFGMTLFFVLSGFVIQYNYEKLFAGTGFTWALVDFGGARFARLVPLYAFVAIIGILFDGLPSWLNTQPRDLAIFGLHEATLTHSWFYITVNNGRLVGQNGFGLSWSVSTEMFFYLVFPFVTLPLAFLRSPGKAILVTLAFAVAAQILFIEAFLWREYIPLWGKALIPFASGEPGQELERWLLYESPWARLFEFLLGCLTALTFMRLSSRPVSPREARLGLALTGLALALMAVIGVLNWPGVDVPGASGLVRYLVNRSFGTTLPTALLIFCVARYRTPVSLTLAAPAMVLLGELSYSIYALQYPIVRPFFLSDQGAPPPADLPSLITMTGKIGMAVVLTLVASYGSYRVLEVPARTWIRRRVGAGLTAALGSKAENARTVPRSAVSAIGFSLGGLAVILLACAIYQFVVVARFMASIP